MQNWQILFLQIFLAFNAGLAIYGFWQTYKYKNAYGQASAFMPIGIFVWGDAFIFGTFWAGATLVCLLLQDWILFLLIFSIFWLVRSIGETIYWFNQQFSTVIRERPQKYLSFRIFQNEFVWVAFQMTLQCITVVTIITSLYLAKLWLAQF